MEKRSGGYCEVQNEAVESCQQKCLQNFIFKECKCLPTYIGENFTLCSSNECVEKSLTKIQPCNCSLPCQRISFSVREISMSRMLSKNNNYSKITVTFKDKAVLVQSQNQRLITVDLLSFVAGSMGLFLGMSCITLLEVFMYLFKAVWGTMNSDRYKKYLSNILGEKVGNILHTDPDINRSHEEIVITQTAKFV